MLATRNKHKRTPASYDHDDLSKAQLSANERLSEHLQRAEIELSFALAEARAANSSVSVAMIEFALAALRSSMQ
jgi:hypothetical protein